MVDLERYVTFRKLIADIVWYRKTEKIDELSVQVAQHSDMDIFLHCGDDKQTGSGDGNRWSIKR